MAGSRTSVTPERFASGITFEQYLAYIGTPENLSARARPRRARAGTGAAQMRALVRGVPPHRGADGGHPLAGEPAERARPRSSCISEEWSSDCRRDVPMLARLAEAGGMELRIFPRDGQKFSASQRPSLAEAPDSNADVMAEFLNEKNGQTWQSIPVAVVLHEGPRVPLSLHGVPGDLREGPAGRGTHPAAAAGRDEGGDAVARGPRVHGAPAVAVLPPLGERRGRRDRERAAPPRRARRHGVAAGPGAMPLAKLGDVEL